MAQAKPNNGQDPSRLNLPPHNLEAEESILSAVLFDNSTLLDLLDILTPDDFYHKHHQVIFTAISELFTDNQPIDLVTLTNRLQETNKLKQAGGRGLSGESGIQYPPGGQRQVLRQDRLRQGLPEKADQELPVHRAAVLRGRRGRGRGDRFRGKLRIRSFGKQDQAVLLSPFQGHRRKPARHRGPAGPQVPDHGSGDRVHPAGPDDLRVSEVRPDHSRGPAQHGQDRLRPEPRQKRRGQGKRADGRIFPGNVQGTAFHENALFGSQSGFPTSCAPVFSNPTTGTASPTPPLC